MRLETENKTVSVVTLLVAAATICWIIISEVELQKTLESAAQAGWAVDISPDPQQRDIRLTLALILGGIAVWSRKGTKVALILFGLIYLLAEFISWVVASQYNPFDRTSAEIHIAAGIMLLIALLLWLRGVSHMIISALMPFYLLFEYFVWYLKTFRLKSSANVEELDLTTGLNNIFYGAHWWHIVILVTAILLVICQVRIILKQRTNHKASLQAV
jgi:hypothetical protein